MNCGHIKIILAQHNTVKHDVNKLIEPICHHLLVLKHYSAIMRIGNCLSSVYIFPGMLLTSLDRKVSMFCIQ